MCSCQATCSKIIRTAHTRHIPIYPSPPPPAPTASQRQRRQYSTTYNIKVDNSPAKSVFVFFSCALVKPHALKQSGWRILGHSSSISVVCPPPADCTTTVAATVLLHEGQQQPGNTFFFFSSCALVRPHALKQSGRRMPGTCTSISVVPPPDCTTTAAAALLLHEGQQQPG